MPKVSIVTPCFNSERYVAGTIKSVRAQTLPDWEHVVVDDGSMDGSAAVVKSYSGREPRLRLVEQANGGVSRARNQGYSVAAPSEYLLFLDADDCLEPAMLETLVGYLDTRPEAGMVYCKPQCVDENDSACACPGAFAPRQVPRGLGVAALPETEAETPLLSIFTLCGLLPSLALLRQSVYAKTGGWDEAFGQVYEDTDLFLRMALFGPVHHLPQPLVRYRRHPAQSTALKTSRDREAVQQAKLYAKWSAAAGLTPEQQDRLAAAHAFRAERGNGSQNETDFGMKRILFCTPAPLTKSLGAAKVVVELAEEMEALGWKCEVRGRFDLDAAAGQAPIDNHVYGQRLRRFLQAHSGSYDVVEYDHGHLPYPRTDFAPQTLFVARSVLLAHHFEKIAIPHGRSWKSRARHLLCNAWERSAARKRTRRAHHTLQAADLVNVCNEEDKAELVAWRIDGGKIVVLPFGISRGRRPLFDAVPSAVPPKPVVAFVGTYDYRKGAREFPAIAESIADAVPAVRFRLLGTAGMFQREAEVLAHFPASLRHRITVVPRFAPEELPALLAPCSVGIFPSHIEGFGFGVLEMLAASVPVIAYDAPGPPMMLPWQQLVPCGDAKAMSIKVAALLNDEKELRRARLRACKQSQKFAWKEIAETTSEIYTQRQVKP